MADHDRNLTQDEVLLMIADGGEETFPLDPIRVMKGAFLVSQIGAQEWRSLFNFRPYHYGPFDSSVYTARDRLLAAGLLSATPVGRYDRYAVTDSGRTYVAELEQRLSGRDADWLRQVGRYVTSRSFSQLLEEIYEKYPEYAARTVMR